MEALEEKMKIILLTLTKLFCSTTLLLIVVSCSSKPPLVEKKFSTDAHMHIHSPDGNDDLQFTGDRARLALDSIDLKRGIVLSQAYFKGVTKAKARKENHYVAQETKQYSTYLAGACALNPMVPWVMEELLNCHKDELKLIKLHTVAAGMDLRIGKELNHLKTILEEAQKLNKTVLIHGNFTKPNEAEILLRTLEQYPKLNIIIGHLLGKDYELLAGFHHPQYFVEISGAPFAAKKSEEKEKLVGLMRRVGMEKFIFGSDWPVFHPAEMLKSLKKLPLNTVELDQILYTNAEKLNFLF